MRKIIAALILFLAIAFIYFSFSELENIGTTLHHSDLRFLGAALLIEIIWLLNNAVTLRSIYRLVGIEERKAYMFLVISATNFINTIAPSAGIGGMAILWDEAKKRNHSAGKVTFVGTLYILMDYAAFICVLALGWIVLIRRNNLSIAEVIASIVLLLIAFAFASVVYLGYRSQERLGRVLAWMARTVNRILRPFMRRDYLQVGRAYVFAEEFAEGIASVKGRNRQMLWPFLFSLNNKALLVCILALSFLSFTTPFSVGTIVAGFSIGHLITIVSPTPAGLGFVEGALPLTLNSLGVPWEAAILITLAYRALTFWFFMAVGAVAFRLLQREGLKESGR